MTSVPDLSYYNILVQTNVRLVNENEQLRSLNEDLLAVCEKIYSEVGKGGDLDWHLRETYAEELREVIARAGGSHD